MANKEDSRYCLLATTGRNGKYNKGNIKLISMKQY